MLLRTMEKKNTKQYKCLQEYTVYIMERQWSDGSMVKTLGSGQKDQKFCCEYVVLTERLAPTGPEGAANRTVKCRVEQ